MTGRANSAMSAADRQAWASARTLADLGELTARWLEGAVASQPTYMPGCGPDTETAPLVPVLARCNRAGYLTCCSQPGEAGTGSDGAWWSQRAAVEGFACPGLAWRIWEAATAAGLVVIAHAPATLPRWRIGYDHAVPVTQRWTEPRTWFAARLSRRHLRDEWTGYGLCHRAAVDAVCAAWQVTVIDPDWCRNDRLWPVLASAVAAGAAPGPGDPIEAVNRLGAVWSPDFAAYAARQLGASAVRCVLCGHAPCTCPPFGTPEYMALVDRLHGRIRGGDQ